MTFREFLESFPTKYCLRGDVETPSQSVSREEILGYFSKPRVIRIGTKGGTLRVYVSDNDGTYGLTVSREDVLSAFEKCPKDELTGEEFVEALERIVLHLLEKKYGELLTVYAVLPVVKTRVERPGRKLREKRTEEKTEESKKDNALDEFLKELEELEAESDGPSV